MKPLDLMDRRVRGFRVVELGAVCILLALILVVYLAKTHAGGERADIDQVQSQIIDEETRIRLLKAEVADLEQPERLEALSGRYLHLAPIPADHEVTPEGLADVAHPPAAAPATKSATAAAQTSANPVTAASVDSGAGAQH
jgi:cell division protein FtsL